MSLLPVTHLGGIPVTYHAKINEPLELFNAHLEIDASSTCVARVCCAVFCCPIFACLKLSECCERNVRRLDKTTLEEACQRINSQMKTHAQITEMDDLVSAKTLFLQHACVVLELQKLKNFQSRGYKHDYAEVITNIEHDMQKLFVFDKLRIILGKQLVEMDIQRLKEVAANKLLAEQPAAEAMV